MKVVLAYDKSMAEGSLVTPPRSAYGRGDISFVFSAVDFLSLTGRTLFYRAAISHPDGREVWSPVAELVWPPQFLSGRSISRMSASAERVATVNHRDGRAGVHRIGELLDRLVGVETELRELHPDAVRLRFGFRIEDGGKAVAVRFMNQRTRLCDITPLRGLPVHTLDLSSSLVADVSPLARMPLASLSLRGTKVRNIGALSSLPLTQLDLSQSLVEDISPLANVDSLAELNLSGLLVRDIAPLGRLQLRKLNLSYTSTKDVRVLRGMPLQELNLKNTPVADISPLSGMPLQNLNIANTNVVDTSTLLSCQKLRAVTIPWTCKRVAPLRELPSVEVINGLPRDKFWESYDSTGRVPGTMGTTWDGMDRWRDRQAPGMEHYLRNATRDGAKGRQENE